MCQVLSKSKTLPNIGNISFVPSLCDFTILFAPYYENAISLYVSVLFHIEPAKFTLLLH